MELKVQRSELPARTLLVVAGLVLVAAIAWQGRPGGRLELGELRSIDYRFRLRGVRPVPLDRVVIIAIDDRSLAAAELGRWPWSRAVHARAVDKLTALGAAAIVFDVFFVESGKDLAGDRRFADAVRRSGKVFLATFSSRGVTGAAGKWPVRTAATKMALPRAPAFVQPISALASAAAGIGYVDVVPDPDGIYRRFYPACVSHADGRVYLWLPVLVACRMRGLNPTDFAAVPGRYLAWGGSRLVIPIDGRGRALLNCRQPLIRRVSYIDLLQGKVKPHELRGKICFVGATAPGLYDVRPVPTNPRAIGVEILAETTQRLLDGELLTPVPPGWGLATTLLLGMLCVLAAAFLRPLLSLAAAGAVFLGYNAAVIALFRGHGVVAPMAAPSLAMVAGYGMVAVVLLVTVERSAWKLRRSLVNYVPPAVAAELAADPDEVKLDGEKRIITALVSDLRGFTSFSEQEDPEHVVAVLNEYFGVMTEIAWKYEGTVDKFMGDGLFVFFNAPADQPDHAERAVRTALEMLAALEELNRRWLAEGRKPFGIGFGINTGPAVVGNMGAPGRRLDYTAVGDVVNVAFRLQAATRKIGKPVLITSATWELVKDVVVAEEIGDVQLVGRQAPVHVYAVRALREQRRQS